VAGLGIYLSTPDLFNHVQIFDILKHQGPKVHILVISDKFVFLPHPIKNVFFFVKRRCVIY
jgi:hypothetical protein